MGSVGRRGAAWPAYGGNMSTSGVAIASRVSGTGRIKHAVAAVTTVLVISSLLVVGGNTGEATATTGQPGFGVGSTGLATPASGSRYIYVATNGDDFVSEYQEWLPGYKDYLRDVCLTQEPDSTGKWGSQSICPEPTKADPLRTVQLAMRIARPGDVIVIRAGTYSEAIGWGITVGTASKPITMQSHPGETVTVAGQLTLSGPAGSGSLVGPDYWRIRGIRFVSHSSLTVNQAIVTISGGTGWAFENNSITGSTGVANLLVVNKAPESSSSSQRLAGAPKTYAIRGNCITNNRGTGAHGQYHNIYMMPSTYSTDGVIEHNLLAGAPRGANIKIAAANPTQGWRSPANLVISDNTLLDAASGITVGLNTRDIDISRNLIARPLNELQYDGAVKTYQMVHPGLIGFKDSYVSDYNQVVEYDGGTPPPIYTARIETGPATFTGSTSDCSIQPTSWPASSYGHITVAEGDVFRDVPPGRAFESEILWLAESGVTQGYSDGTFRPLSSVNRDAMAAFLYRFAGSPVFTPPSHSPFTDVTSSTPFYKEITWLATTGITGGFSDGTFRPSGTVNRDAMAAFLYRFAGRPSFEPPTDSPFSDITSSSPFYREVTWLATTGVTGGFTDGTFRAGQSVNRDAMAAFLFRFNAKGLKPPP